eukprot:6209196-Pyramimonas_sp.AAC.1
MESCGACCGATGSWGRFDGAAAHVVRIVQDRCANNSASRAITVRRQPLRVRRSRCMVLRLVSRAGAIRNTLTRYFPNQPPSTR